MATTTTTNKHDDYWKLIPDQYKMTVKEMRTELQRRNYPVGGITDKGHLRHCLYRSDRGRLSHHTLTNRELRERIASRKIDASEVISKYRKGPREELLRLLEDDDMHPKFHRFSELPPELRVKLYEYYVGEFRQPIYAPSQPPLSKTSSLLRRELLPIFYASCSFKIRLTRTDGRERALVTMPTRMLLFLHGTRPEHFALIKAIHICVAAGPMSFRASGQDDLMKVLEMQITLPTDEKDAVSVDLPHRDTLTQLSTQSVRFVRRLDRAVRKLFEAVMRRGKNKVTREDIFALRRLFEAKQD
ncbi:hypothetical protein BAUCODRAFT_436962 [Baudoinia panamericana UAMH 10762]|uniref:Uncharacterized protein n=1 Tax=Baudoinia panamericana (strain UAMH 10762) TaxID=717646 RepID=M2NCY4_BAUPA|nr:uncharacterized protein BAUCODRAFT_436962 [Baudoinia panamericana UAMH 10762]EMC97054.1 hypothetical protein BAUCODRAFT_436962 [Baudoinia panamericana UAMH 10762]